MLAEVRYREFEILINSTNNVRTCRIRAFATLLPAPNVLTEFFATQSFAVKLSVCIIGLQANIDG